MPGPTFAYTATTILRERCSFVGDRPGTPHRGYYSRFVVYSSTNGLRSLYLYRQLTAAYRCCYAVVTTMTSQTPTEGPKTQCRHHTAPHHDHFVKGGGPFLFYFAALRVVGKYVAILIPIYVNHNTIQVGSSISRQIW